ncbi:MAG: hypothetical protein V9H26_18115 [Verrucomicrobiota bacterium]|nr:hypothetical protein [Verrucomicrobiota bacterium]MCC6822570.1 hypothetical protein [Limisphaerales bacterium]
MNRRLKKSSDTVPLRWARAGLLLGLFLFVLALAQFGALHHFFHADSKQPNHHCAATMLAGGQIDAAPPCAVAVVVSPIQFVVTITELFPIFVSFDFTLPLSCGPPALRS